MNKTVKKVLIAFIFCLVINTLFGYLYMYMTTPVTNEIVVSQLDSTNESLLAAPYARNNPLEYIQPLFNIIVFGYIAYVSIKALIKRDKNN